MAITSPFTLWVYVCGWVCGYVLNGCVGASVCFKWVCGCRVDGYMDACMHVYIYMHGDDCMNR